LDNSLVGLKNNMLTKEEILQGIKDLASQNQITKSEVMMAFGQEIMQTPEKKKAGVAITDILYYIGGAVVFMGIGIFVFQNWSSLNSFTRVISTLGSAVAAYFVAILLFRNEKTKNIGVAFHLISALVMPLGLHITFHEAGFNTGTREMQAFISAILLSVYLSSLAIFKKDLFIVFSVIFGTWFFFAFTSFILNSSPLFGKNFSAYRALLTGLTYVFLGHSLSSGKHRGVTGFLYGFGVLGVLSSALFLGGWKPNQLEGIFWEVVYPGLIFIVLFLSINLKSGSFLTFGTIFLMAYIIKITAEYFSGSMGWPLSLVVIGLLLIASGYLFIFLRNKYIKR